VFNVQYSSVFCVNKSSHSVTQNTEEYFILKTVRRFIYTKYWGIVNADHCGKIYWHKTLSSHSVQHTIFCVNKSSHSVEHKVISSILCKWISPVFNIKYFPVVFKQNTEEYCMLNTGKIYLHKILRNILYVEHCVFLSILSK
jgi:hypothetical protein